MKKVQGNSCAQLARHRTPESRTPKHGFRRPESLGAFVERNGCLKIGQKGPVLKCGCVACAQGELRGARAELKYRGAGNPHLRLVLRPTGGQNQTESQSDPSQNRILSSPGREERRESRITYPVDRAVRSAIFFANCIRERQTGPKGPFLVESPCSTQGILLKGRGNVRGIL